MAAHFEDITEVRLSKGDLGRELFFRRGSPEPKRDAKVEGLRDQFEETLIVLKEMELGSEAFDELFTELLVGAQIGLAGEAYSLDSGRTQLELVRRRMVRLQRAKRDNYLKQLGVRCGLLALASVVLALCLSTVEPTDLSVARAAKVYAGLSGLLLALCWLHVGLAVGMVFTGFSTNRLVNYERINLQDPYFFSPGARVAYICIVGYVLMAALWFDVLKLGFAGLLLNDVRTKPAVAILIGLVSATSEAFLVQLLQSRLRPAEKQSTRRDKS